jgi:hypothetical protein
MIGHFVYVNALAVSLLLGSVKFQQLKSHPIPPKLNSRTGPCYIKIISFDNIGLREFYIPCHPQSSGR